MNLVREASGRKWMTPEVECLRTQETYDILELANRRDREAENERVEYSIRDGMSINSQVKILGIYTDTDEMNL